MKKRFFRLFVCLALSLSAAAAAAGCAAEGAALGDTTAPQLAAIDQTGGASDSVVSSSTTETEASGQPTAAVYDAQTVDYDDDDLDAGWDPSSAAQVGLAGDSIEFGGSGATIDGSTITITAAGTYVLSGTLTDGRLIVDTADDETVHLVLDGADITCFDSAPIYVASAKKTVITLADGAGNRVADGATYAGDDSESDAPNAAIFSNDDLTINGSGSLTVTACHNDGIASDDELKIVGGAITVNAVNDAIQGRDCLGVKAGTITVTSGGDGLQATNDQDSGKGYIAIEGGTFVIASGGDAIQAQTTLRVSGGDFAISTGGGSANSSQNAGQNGNTWGDWDGSAQAGGASGAGDSSVTTSGSSAKALKAAVGVFVTGGTFAIDSSDDSIHSNGTVTISAGTVELSSGDDGIHADGSLTIEGGELIVTKSYEGLEASTITIGGGTMHITASDDGLNVAGGADSSSVSGRPGQNDFAANSDNALTITGGYLVVNSGGDGLDSNGTITMTGGTAIVNGPIEDMNGALDAQALGISGGYLVAVGSAGMAEAPSETSTQRSLMVVFDEAQTAGTLVHIESEDGDNVLTFSPAKQFQAVVFSSADLKEGETYVVYLGGTATGTIADGVYSDGSYAPGSQNVTLSLDAMVTISGSAGGFGGRGAGGPGH